MKSALVTGSAGFVGRHINQALLDLGWAVTCCDLREDRPGCRYDALSLFGGKAPCTTVFDLVVHCAYWVGGRRGIDREPVFLARNIQLDSAMFSWAVRTRQRAVLYFSSSAAYPVRYQMLDLPERLTENMIDLDNVGQPDARYGWAKLTGEQLARAASLSGLRVHVVRPFSGYGEDQDTAYPFPSIIRRICENDCSVWGPKGQTRDWIHIDDVVDGALAVYDADCRMPVNLCSGTGTEFGDLVRLMARAAGYQEVPDVEYQVSKPTGTMVRYGDPTRMRDLYQPKISLEAGIRRALEVIS